MPFTTDQIIFLINPHSGATKRKGILNQLQFLEPNLHYYMCKSPDHLQSFFSTLMPQFKVVVVCGGDGTVNSVLPYANNSNLLFSVIPTGSGNGFANEMGYTKRVDKQLEIIKSGKFKEIDVLKVNEEYSCNISGMGFDAHTAHKFDQSNKRGLTTYLYEAFKGFMTFKSFSASVKVNTSQHRTDYFMLCFANTRQFGNNIIVAPNAKANDGLIDLVMIKKFPKILTPWLLFCFFVLKGKNSNYINYQQVRELEVCSSNPYYHIDGEPRLNSSETLKVGVAGKMNVICE